MSQSNLVAGIANAIAQMESGGNPNALNYRNNNPGNLVSWGSNPIVNGFAQFPTLQAGWNALYSQIQTNINRGLNLYQFFGGGLGYPGYASSGSSASNNPVNYANFVAGQVGIDPNTPLNQIDPNTLASTGTTGDGSTADTAGIDNSSPTDTTGTDTGSTDGSISTGLLVGLGIAGILLFWAFWD